MRLNVTTVASTFVVAKPYCQGLFGSRRAKVYIVVNNSIPHIKVMHRFTGTNISNTIIVTLSFNLWKIGRVAHRGNIPQMHPRWTIAGRNAPNIERASRHGQWTFAQRADSILVRSARHRVLRVWIQENIFVRTVHLDGNFVELARDAIYGRRIHLEDALDENIRGSEGTVRFGGEIQHALNIETVRCRNDPGGSIVRGGGQIGNGADAARNDCR
mmetsp:Transcript_39275/g.82580  ORF Transcript_39275/g.82580 Transcript_39275/m.82580 type:complete len:215 (-) Transcript_39275:501-1145(-)